MECNGPGFTTGSGVGLSADPSVDLSADTDFCIAGSCRLMDLDDGGHAKMILIDYYYYYYYYNVNSWRMWAISNYKESTLILVWPRWLERQGWELALLHFFLMTVELTDTSVTSKKGNWKSTNQRTLLLESATIQDGISGSWVGKRMVRTFSG